MADENKTAPVADAPEVKEAPATAEATDKKDVEVPAKFKSLVEEVEKMSVMDLAELVKILEDKLQTKQT